MKAWKIISKKWEIEAAVQIQKVARTYIVIKRQWKKIVKIRKAK